MRYLDTKITWSGEDYLLAVGQRHEVYDVLVVGDQQADLTGDSRGFFFEPPDTVEKAQELVEIGYPGAVVLETAGQYLNYQLSLVGRGIPGDSKAGRVRNKGDN